MKALTIILSAAILSATTLSAHGGGRYEPPRHVKVSHHNNGANWVIPMVIGGVLGYALSEPQRDRVTYVSSVPAPAVYAPPSQVVYTQNAPVYEERWVYFSDCGCERKVLVPIR